MNDARVGAPVQPVHWVLIERCSVSMEAVMSMRLEGVRSNIHEEGGTMTHLKVKDAFEYHFQNESQLINGGKLQEALSQWIPTLPTEGVLNQLIANFKNKVTYALLSDEEAIIGTTDRRCEVAIVEWRNVVFSFYAAACEGRETAKPWFFEKSHPLQPHQRFFHKPLRNKPSPTQLERLKYVPITVPDDDRARYGHQCDKSHFTWEDSNDADPAWSHIRESWPYVLDMMSVNGYDIDDSQYNAFQYLHCLKPDCQYQYATSLMDGNVREHESNRHTMAIDCIEPTTKTAIVYVLKSMTQSASTGVEAIKSIANFGISAGVTRIHIISVLPFSTKVSAEVASRKSDIDIILWPIAHHKFEWFNHAYNVPMAGIHSAAAAAKVTESATATTGDVEDESATPFKLMDDASVVRNFLHHAVLAFVFTKPQQHDSAAHSLLEREAMGHLFDSKYDLMRQNLDGPASKRLELKQDDVIHLQKRYPKTSKVMRRVVKFPIAKQ